ncbi:MAG: F0F1 ATP synthase subunit gamma [Actinomycetes bacterium]
MSAQQRIRRQRIRDTQSTMKITRAMELIAASRIVKAQQAVHATEPYGDALQRALTLAASHSQIDHPLFTEVKHPKRAAVLTVAADRGLAGAYSSNAIKAGERVAANITERGIEPVTYLVGRKSVGYYKFRDRVVEGSWVGFSDNPTYANAKEVADSLLDAFLKQGKHGGIDEIHIVYTKFINRLSQVPKVLRLVPLDIVEEVVDTHAPTITAGEGKGGKAAWPLYDFEPEAKQTLDVLLPRYIEHLVYVGLLESAASEHASRQRAMKSATDNANDLIKRFLRQANQARQAEITQEISEIVGGANALAAAK